MEELAPDGVRSALFDRPVHPLGRLRNRRVCSHQLRIPGAPFQRRTRPLLGLVLQLGHVPHTWIWRYCTDHFLWACPCRTRSRYRSRLPRQRHHLLTRHVWRRPEAGISHRLTRYQSRFRPNRFRASAQTRRSWCDGLIGPIPREVRTMGGRDAGGLPFLSNHRDVP